MGWPTGFEPMKTNFLMVAILIVALRLTFAKCSKQSWNLTGRTPTMRLFPLKFGIFCCSSKNRIQINRHEHALQSTGKEIHFLFNHKLAVGANPGDPDRRGLLGQHNHHSASRRRRGFKKIGPQAIGCSRGGCTAKIHLVAANARCAMSLALSPVQAGDAPQGRELLRNGGPVPAGWCRRAAKLNSCPDSNSNALIQHPHFYRRSHCRLNRFQIHSEHPQIRACSGLERIGLGLRRDFFGA